MQIEIALEKEKEQASQHLNRADAGRDGDHPDLAHATLAQQAHHVRWQRGGHRHQQNDENADQQKGSAANQLPQAGIGPFFMGLGSYPTHGCAA